MKHFWMLYNSLFKVLPSCCSVLALISTVLLTFSLLLSCASKSFFVASWICSANQFAIDEVLSPVSPFIIAALLSPGLLIVIVATIFNIWHKDVYIQCVEMLRGEEVSFQDICSGVLFTRWGKRVGWFAVLFFVMDFLAIKINTTFNGVVIGLVLYLQILSSTHGLLLLGLCGMSYVLMIYPAFIKWRVVSGSKVKQADFLSQ
ncbi:hypothetical protein [Pseudomonas sp. PS02303]|uniref:hypothetical protein n=1 Tax=Pseudomonas sp. PS02303 TaxID=2991429 RepID=UPI00249BFB83|nr:hypothetical protein [Pseudomonas sp. PS02303]